MSRVCRVLSGKVFRVRLRASASECSPILLQGHSQCLPVASPLTFRHARPCAGHPRLCVRPDEDVDGRDEPGHDDHSQCRTHISYSTYQTANHSGVIARLDRAIQYSRDVSVKSDASGILDAPPSRSMTADFNERPSYSTVKQPCVRVSAARLRPDDANKTLVERGRRKRRVLSHTHSLMCESEKAHELQSPQVWPVQSGVSCAIGFNGFLRALPGDRAFLSPLSARCE